MIARYFVLPLLLADIGREANFGVTAAFHFSLSVILQRSGCSVVIGCLGCPSSAVYRGIGLLRTLCTSWLYLSRCDRLISLPAPRTAPAPSSSSTRGRRNCWSSMCHFQHSQYAAGSCCNVTPWDYFTGFVVGGK